MDRNRRGENGRVPFRAGRVFTSNNQWFFYVRNGGHRGPYPTREQLDVALTLFLRQQAGNPPRAAS